MKFVLALIAAIAFAPAALAVVGDNHPAPCSIDANGVPSQSCNDNGGAGPDKR